MPRCLSTDAEFIRKIDVLAHIFIPVLISINFISTPFPEIFPLLRLIHMTKLGINSHSTNRTRHTWWLEPCTAEEAFSWKAAEEALRTCCAFAWLLACSLLAFPSAWLHASSHPQAFRGTRIQEEFIPISTHLFSASIHPASSFFLVLLGASRYTAIF